MLQILALLVLALRTSGVNGHGTMMEPTQRSSLWRIHGADKFHANYNDNELFCGGVDRQWKQNGGKCGTCGDPYDAEIRENEAGGKYATGFIAKSYTEGQQIEVKIDLTAPHAGFFEFRVCPHNNVSKPVTQECLDNHLLKTDSEETRYHPGFRTGEHVINLQLPSGITCAQCVLQWHYLAGNTWGCDEDGTCCTGCGQQETFRNCADISII